MQNLFLFPLNGNVIEAISCINLEKFRLLGFIDDAVDKQGQSCFGYKVFSSNVLKKESTTKVLSVPGSPDTYIKRRNIINSLNLTEDRFATIIHPSAFISPLAKIGFNVLIMAGVVITSNAVIGNHVCILPNTVIHHHTIIGNYCLIGSNVTVAGYTVINENCYIGSSTSIINGITIGAFSLIGLGTNVIKNVPPYSKVVGNPSRIIGKSI